MGCPGPFGEEAARARKSRHSSPAFPLSRHGPAGSSPTAEVADRAVQLDLRDFLPGFRPKVFHLRGNLLSINRGSVEVVQVRLEHPEIPVSHDPAVALLGVQERSRGPAYRHGPVSPPCHPACAAAHSRVDVVDHVGRAQAPPQRSSASVDPQHPSACPTSSNSLSQPLKGRSLLNGCPEKSGALYN